MTEEICYFITWSLAENCDFSSIVTRNSQLISIFVRRNFQFHYTIFWSIRDFLPDHLTKFSTLYHDLATKFAIIFAKFWINFCTFFHETIDFITWSLNEICHFFPIVSRNPPFCSASVWWNLCLIFVLVLRNLRFFKNWS